MFLNTDSRYYARDLLQEEEGRPGYFARHLPDFDIDGIDRAGWRRLTRLREAIRALLADQDPDAPVRLGAVAHGYPLVFRMEGARIRAAPVRAGNEHAIAVAVLAALHAATQDGRLSRLRFCARPECGWCFYDGTKNRSGRWCSTDPCGDVMKARAYRSRNRDEREPRVTA